ncbi:MAG: hypothetical protein VKQ33_10450 [Candidatus Sericytochromatia bacterium]|nr:hypothetical protein [Candidatus Sericytochromatia bacterium]
MTRALLSMLCLAAVSTAGCSDLAALGGLPLPLGGGGGPTVSGTVKGMSGAGVRVGVLGSSTAGGKQREIASTEVTDGAFTLTLPGRAPVDMMEQPAETRSVVFTLRAYADANRNGRYDDGETLCECSSGQFRYVESDGPVGSYKAGWNVVSGGRFTQNFTTAFVI